MSTPTRSARSASAIPRRAEKHQGVTVVSPTPRAGCTCSTTTQEVLLKSYDNSTFDGSSIQASRCRPRATCAWASTGRRSSRRPTCLGRASAVLASLRARWQDLRGRRAAGSGRYSAQRFEKDGSICYAANEIEGFLFIRRDAERHFHEHGHLDYAPPAATTTRPAIRCVSSSIAAAEAQGATPTRRDPEVAPTVRDETSYAEAALTRRPVPACRLLSSTAAKMDMTVWFPLRRWWSASTAWQAHQHLGRCGKSNLFHDK